MAYFLYILYSDSKDLYYIGQTDNLKSRLEYHNSGYVLSTKHGRPWKLIHFKEYPNRSDAMKEETRLKKARNRVYLEWYIKQG